MNAPQIETAIWKLVGNSPDWGRTESFRYWELFLSVQDASRLVFLIDERQGDERIILFQRKFPSADVSSLVSWYREKLEILKDDAVRMKELGFRQFRNGEFELNGDKFFLNLSRDIFRPVYCSAEEYEIGSMSVVFNGIGYSFDSPGSLMDVLKNFLRKNVDCEDFLLFPQKLRDFALED